MKYTLGFIVLILLVACDPVTLKLELVNNSEETKYYIIMLDTTLKNYLPLPAQEISPHHSEWPIIGFGKGKDFWAKYINKHSIDSTLYIYIFDTNHINDRIINEKKYERLDLKVKDLDSLNWKVNCE